MSSPSRTQARGVTRACLERAPRWCSKMMSSDACWPPTLPPLALKSAMTPRFISSSSSSFMTPFPDPRHERGQQARVLLAADAEAVGSPRLDQHRLVTPPPLDRCAVLTEDTHA